MMVLRNLMGVSVGLALLLLAGCAIDTTRPLNPEEVIREGETLYVENCSGCHQSDGRGWAHLYPNLAGNPIVTLHDVEPMVVTVLNGQGSMPAFRTRLSSEEIAAILSYIRNSWGNEAPAITAKHVN